MAEEDQDVKGLEVLQSMIDGSAKRLVGLRTQCATSNLLTQSEIRTLEVSMYQIWTALVPRNLTRIEGSKVDVLVDSL